MEELLLYIVKNLVTNEDAVSVSETVEEDGTQVYLVSVSEEDKGRIIGKGGNIAKSIRTIIKSISSRNHQKVFVKFGD